MSQVTGPLSINDGLATPVARSFAPMRVAPDQSVFCEKTSAVSAGYKRLKIGLSSASASRPTNRVDVELQFPVISTVGGVSTVAYTGMFKGYFVMPEVMTAAERADLAAFVANSFDNAQIRGVIKDLDPLY